MKTVRIDRVGTLPEGLDLLVQASLEEGFGMVKRLKENWLSGSNTFSLEGEAYFEARRGVQLVGVAGLNRDPYHDNDKVGRVRHMYVLPSERRCGIGRMLVDAVLDHARGHFTVLQLRSTTGDNGAVKFYESLGFEPVDGVETVTHRMEFRQGKTAGCASG
jgi:GNAT superfamily N-acetyltransferase